MPEKVRQLIEDQSFDFNNIPGDGMAAGNNDKKRGE